MDYNKSMYNFMREYCLKHNPVAVARVNIRLSYEKLDREVRGVAG
jgi:hypothetical protein